MQNSKIIATSFGSEPVEGIHGTDLANYHLDQWRHCGYRIFWEHHEGPIQVDGSECFGHCMLITIQKSLTSTGGWQTKCVKAVCGLDYEACKRCSAFLKIPEFGVETAFLKLSKKALNQILSPWSSSRANEYTKAKAVTAAMAVLNPEGGFSFSPTIELATGAYSAKSHASGRSWTVCGDSYCVEQRAFDGKVLKRWCFDRT